MARNAGSPLRRVGAPIRRGAVRQLIWEQRLAYGVRLTSRAYAYNALDAAGPDALYSANVRSLALSQVMLSQSVVNQCTSA